MTSARADLEEADQRMDRHRAVLAKYSSLLKQLEQHQSFTADRVTVLEDTWGKGRFSKYSALLERLDKQDDVIQDLKEQVAILQGNQCQCFDAGPGSSADAEGELDYECHERNSEEFRTCREGRTKKLSPAGRLTT